MRILVVTQFFPPEVGAGQARLSDFAKLWAAAGHEVTILTGFPNHPTGVVPPGYRGRVRMVEYVDGYRVVRTWLYTTPNEGVLKRAISHLSFMVSSALLGGRIAGPADVVLVSSPMFLPIFSAWALARLKRARFVVEVRDLWPEIVVELGVITNRRIIGALQAMANAAYRASDAVVVVTRGFVDHIAGIGIPRDKIHFIPNGVDPRRFAPDQGDRARGRAKLSASADEVVVLYLGAHGISHGLTSIAEAASLLDSDSIRFAFVGDGAGKAELAARVDQLALDRVTMLPPVPWSEVPDLMAGADIGLVPLRDVNLFSSFIPSKIFELLASGKAVVGSLRGEPARLLEDAGQIVVEPEEPLSLAKAVGRVADDPQLRAEMGRRGRSYVVDHFDRRHQAAHYLGLLERLAARAT